MEISILISWIPELVLVNHDEIRGPLAQVVRAHP